MSSWKEFYKTYLAPKDKMEWAILVLLLTVSIGGIIFLIYLAGQS